ncbi:hypothetical protein HYDPIDRAFT_37902 [Hydnomerulius pinastri MD-312]|nr:hypothetical protein HYDPIDRAFT_37902 [Hydnomerulius pinastri MD-312]
MEPTTQRIYRGRANGHHEGGGPGRRAHHGNRRWVADGATGRSGTSTPQIGSDGERWERGGHRGGGRGRGRGARGKFGNASVVFRQNGVSDGGSVGSEGEHSGMEEETEIHEVEPDAPEDPEEREKFWQELVKAREVERKKAIAEGKMDDPLIPKRLEDAITMVGTCMDMCPRFERYRRERENHLFGWETIPGSKRVDHQRAVKMYERAAGDKTLPSDLRPPEVLQRTLDYLFHDLLPRGGFSATFNFIRDRSRAVRNDFTMQHEMGPVAIECHDRCARFHILALHQERDQPGFSIAMEEQQLMNTLQSLKEFYEDQRGRYQSPTELEMRVYHRLIHIRDQKERHEDIPPSLVSNPVFELTTKFRARVQAKSAPITKTSPLAVDAEAMQIFAELAGVLRREGNVVMTYLVACILERLFGKDTIEDIESIRGDLSLSDVIDGFSGTVTQDQDTDVDITSVEDETEAHMEDTSIFNPPHHELPVPLQPSGTQWLNDTFGPKPTESAFFKATPGGASPQLAAAPTKSAFSNLTSVPNAFGTSSFNVTSAFPTNASNTTSISVFGSVKDSPASVFGTPSSATAGAAVSTSTFGFPAPAVPSPPSNSYSLPTTSSSQPVIPTAPFGQTPPPSRSQAFSPPQPPISNGVHPGTTQQIQQRLLPGLNPQAPVFTPPKLSPFESTSSTFAGGPITSAFNTSPPNSIVHSPESQRRHSDFSSSSGQPHTPHQATPLAAATGTFTPPPPASTNTSVPFFGVMEDPLSKLERTPLTQPPPLSRQNPISLPPTPTATIFIPPSISSKSKSIFGSLGSIQTSALSAAPTEILSPLVLQSPGTSRSSFPSMPHLLRRDSVQSPLRAALNAAEIEAPAEGKLDISLTAGPPPVKKPNLDIMKATAMNFARRSSLVKKSFSQWRHRLTDRVKWIEACRRSKAYSEKAQAERLSRSTGSPLSEKKRKSAPQDAHVPLRKRLKDRLSSEYRPPQNDEELAKRFEKNHEDHARRWARSSFLVVLKSFLDSASKPLPDNWSAWLSLNQENDGTAIWLEQKFDVPNSGKWKNENVFQIPLSKQHAELESCFPGVVIFERTPLAGMTDILEKKYQVLDDCARLREIVEAFPSNRHYIPSLLCVSWNGSEPDVSKDFDDMVESMIGGGKITSAQELLISTTALDMESKFKELLRVTPFDLEGRLVMWLSLHDLFKTWELSWDDMTTRWLNNCTVGGEFHWDLHAKSLEGCVQLLIQMVDAVLGLSSDNNSRSDLPRIQTANALNSDATFDAVLTWLQALPATEVTLSLIDDVKAHQSLGRDFPTMTFLPQLFMLARSVAAFKANADHDVPTCIAKARLEQELDNILTLKVSLEDEMKANHIARLKPLPKRLASFGESISSWSSTPAKKRRLSISDGSLISDEDTPPLTLHQPSPSLSAATSLQSLDRSVVTPAMLRSLTRDLRAKYGSGSR